MEESMLSINNLNISYIGSKEKMHAVKDVNLEVIRGDALGIVGESGSGKSTLAMGVLRLLSTEATEINGSALFCGEDLLSMNEERLKEIRWCEIAVVFQKSMNSFSPVHKIGDQLSDIYRVHHKNAKSDEIKTRIDELFKLVKLDMRVYNSYPHELSGGMLQRVAIVASLLHKPKLLIFDEATTALDVITQWKILNDIKEMQNTMDLTRIMITHDMAVVSNSCNKVAVMYKGEIVEYGLTSEVFKNPSHEYTRRLLASIHTLRKCN